MQYALAPMAQKKKPQETPKTEYEAVFSSGESCTEDGQQSEFSADESEDSGSHTWAQDPETEENGDFNLPKNKEKGKGEKVVPSTTRESLRDKLKLLLEKNQSGEHQEEIMLICDALSAELSNHSSSTPSSNSKKLLQTARY